MFSGELLLVLYISQGRVTYTVVLEGLCRFSVQELGTRGTCYTARISPLEMTKAGEFSIKFGEIFSFSGRY